MQLNLIENGNYNLIISLGIIRTVKMVHHMRSQRFSPSSIFDISVTIYGQIYLSGS